MRHKYVTRCNQVFLQIYAGKREGMRIWVKSQGSRQAVSINQGWMCHSALLQCTCQRWLTASLWLLPGFSPTYPGLGWRSMHFQSAIRILGRLEHLLEGSGFSFLYCFWHKRTANLLPKRWDNLVPYQGFSKGSQCPESPSDFPSSFCDDKFIITVHFGNKHKP